MPPWCLRGRCFAGLPACRAARSWALALEHSTCSVRALRAAQHSLVPWHARQQRRCVSSAALAAFLVVQRPLAAPARQQFPAVSREARWLLWKLPWLTAATTERWAAGQALPLSHPAPRCLSGLHADPSASSPALLLSARQGDYHRYLAEFKTGTERKEAAEHTLLAYKAAQVRHGSGRGLGACQRIEVGCRHAQQ